MITRDDKLALIAEAIIYESEDLNEIIDKVNNLMYKGMAKATIAAMDARDKVTSAIKGKTPQKKTRIGRSVAKGLRRGFQTTQGGDKLAPPVGSIRGAQVGGVAVAATLASDALRHARADYRRKRLAQLEAKQNKSQTDMQKAQSLRNKLAKYNRQEVKEKLPQSKLKSGLPKPTKRIKFPMKQKTPVTA